MSEDEIGVEAAFITPVSQREAIELVTTFEDVLEEMHRFTEPQREAFMRALRNVGQRHLHETFLVLMLVQAFEGVVRRRENQK